MSHELPQYIYKRVAVILWRLRARDEGLDAQNDVTNAASG
jgi:hypothetical protein